MTVSHPPALAPGDIADEFRSSVKTYGTKTPLAGVKIHRLTRHVDDRGFFQEIYRAQADHPGSESLAEFFRDVPVAQINFTIVNAENHVKGLHYHLRQQDVWFCPHPSKAKFVLFDVRRDSPTSGGRRSSWRGTARTSSCASRKASRTAIGRSRIRARSSTS